MNKIPNTIRIGAYGELHTQLKLLSLGVESFRPLIDTGNDLIAIQNKKVVDKSKFLAIQVKTTQSNNKWNIEKLNEKLYDIICFVKIDPQHDEEHIILENEPDCWLIPRNIYENKVTNTTSIAISKIIKEFNSYSLTKDFENNQILISSLFK